MKEAPFKVKVILSFASIEYRSSGFDELLSVFDFEVIFFDWHITVDIVKQLISKRVKILFILILGI